jgi:hypothetical protein
MSLIEFQLPDHDLTDTFPNSYTSEISSAFSRIVYPASCILYPASCILHLYRNHTNALKDTVDS